MGLSIPISVPKLKLFQRKKVTLQMHESAAVDPPTLRNQSQWDGVGPLLVLFTQLQLDTLVSLAVVIFQYALAPNRKRVRACAVLASK